MIQIQFHLSFYTNHSSLFRLCVFLIGFKSRFTSSKRRWNQILESFSFSKNKAIRTDCYTFELMDRFVLLSLYKLKRMTSTRYRLVLHSNECVFNFRNFSSFKLIKLSQHNTIESLLSGCIRKKTDYALKVVQKTSKKNTTQVLKVFKIRHCNTQAFVFHSLTNRIYNRNNNELYQENRLRFLMLYITWFTHDEWLT